MTKLNSKFSLSYNVPQLKNREATVWSYMHVIKTSADNALAEGRI